MGRLSLCSMIDSFVFFPYEALLPPKACFFHSGMSLGIMPMPLMLSAICLPSAVCVAEVWGLRVWRERKVHLLRD